MSKTPQTVLECLLNLGVYCTTANAKALENISNT